MTHGSCKSWTPVFASVFISKPFQSKEPEECTMGPQMEEVCDKEVTDLLRKKAIAVAPDTPVFFQ